MPCALGFCSSLPFLGVRTALPWILASAMSLALAKESLKTWRNQRFEKCLHVGACSLSFFLHEHENIPETACPCWKIQRVEQSLVTTAIWQRQSWISWQVVNPKPGSAQPAGLPAAGHTCMSESSADQKNPVDGELSQHLWLHANGALRSSCNVNKQCK